MKIQLRTAPRGEWEELEIEQGTTIEAVCREKQDRLPYRMLAAKVDNHFEELTEPLVRPCRVELLDMRTLTANLIYQHSLSLIYLKAVYDCLGDVRVEIQNSLNKGLYTEIKTETPVTAAQIHRIENRMRQIVEADMPFVREIVSRQEAMEIFRRDGRSEKQRLLHESLNLGKVKFYSLGGVRDFFYGLMVPSSSYIEYFELKKYRRGVLLRFPHPSNPSEIPPYVDEKSFIRPSASRQDGINCLMLTTWPI